VKPWRGPCDPMFMGCSNVTRQEQQQQQQTHLDGKELLPCECFYFLKKVILQTIKGIILLPPCVYSVDFFPFDKYGAIDSSRYKI
jgi:hypothetical protein